MKSKALRIIVILLMVILILSIVTLSAGAIAKTNLAKQYPAPGQLVDVGGYKMHIYCTGQGSPTVILASGMSDFSVSWAYVQPEIAKNTRVCSYDRAGLGWSEPSPLPRTANTMAEELHTLLVNADVRGPYIMVGHSLGGMLVRVYTNSYPNEVVGMVLVDATPDEINIRQVAAVPRSAEVSERNIEQAVGQFRMYAFLSSTGLMALMPQSIPNHGLPEEAYAQYQAVLATTGFFETANDETLAVKEIVADVRALHIANFGNMPLVVFFAGSWELDPAFSEAENQQLRDVNVAMESELVMLSSNSKLIIAEESHHFIQLDQPDLVIDAIREILDAIRK